MEKISVIIPVYRVEQYLDTCLNSIVNQTYKNLEIILIDDGSPDNCPKICNDWAKKDERIKVIHKENGGVSSARNCGLEVCNGKYVYFCDSDDFIENDCLEKLVKAIEDNDVVIMGYNIVNGKSIKKITYNNSENPNDFMAEIMHGWDFGLLWNKLYRRELINIKFDEDFKIREDLLFNSEYFKNVKNIGVVNEPLYNYINNPKSLTKGIKKVPMEQLKATHLSMLDMLNRVSKGLIKHQNAIFLKSLINVLKPYAYIKCDENDYSLLREYLNDAMVVDALKEYTAVGVKEKIFIHLIKRKKIKTLLFFIRLMR